MTQDEIIEMAKLAGWEMDDSCVLEPEVIWYISQGQLKAFVKLVAEKERTFCIQFLMELHSAQMGAHNYFHYAAQALLQLEGKELPSKFSLTIDKKNPINKYND